MVAVDTHTADERAIVPVEDYCWSWGMFDLLFSRAV